MNKALLDEIYAKVGENYLDRIHIEETMDAELQPLWESLQASGIALERHRQIESAVWSAANIAEQESFMAGMKFMLRLLGECLS